MTSEQAVAAQVADATGTAYDKNSADPVTAILVKYDKNGDGVFQIDECARTPGTACFCVCPTPSLCAPSRVSFGARERGGGAV